MALSGNFWGNVAAAPVQPKSSGGGIGGFIYNHILKPPVQGASNLLQDAYHGSKAAGMAIGDVATGNHNGGQAILSEIQKAPDFAKPFGGSVQDVKDRSTGSAAEQAAGSLASSGLNAASPFLGAEEFVGKTGIKALVGAGAKIGAKLGAASGAAGAAAQGDSGGDVINNTLSGGAAGAATGVAGGLLGAGIARLSGGKGPLGANNSNSIANKAATNQAVAAEMARRADSEAPFAGLSQTSRQGSRPGTGLQPTLAFAEKLGLPTDSGNVVQSLHNIHGALTGGGYDTPGGGGALSGAFRQILDTVGNVNLDSSKVMNATDKAIDQAGIGDANVKGSGANSARNIVTSVLRGKIGGNEGNDLISQGAARAGQISKNGSVDANKLFDGIQSLESAIRAVPAHTEVGAGKVQVLQAAKNALEDQLYNASGMNDVVKGYIPSDKDEALIRGVTRSQGDTTGTLGQYAIDALRNAKTGQDIRSAQAMPVRAGELASAADRYAEGALTQEPEAEGGGLQGSPAGNIYAAHEVLSHPVIGAPIAAAKYGGKIINGLLAKHGTPDLSQIPARAGSVLPSPGSSINAVANKVSGGRVGSLMGGLIGSGVAQAGDATSGSTNPDATDDGTVSPANLATSSNTGFGTAGRTTSLSGNNDTPNSIFSPKVLQALAISDLEETGGKNLSSIATLGSLFGQNGTQSSQPKLSASQQEKSDAIQNAAGSIQVLQQQFSNAGGSSPIADGESKLPIIGSRLQPDLSAYNATRYDAASALAAATVGGKPTASSIKYWENSLPSATDSPQAAQGKIDNVMQQLIQRGKIYGLSESDLIQ